MIHPDTELKFISASIGYGVVATRLIPKGTIVWCLDDLDQKFSAATVARMDKPYRDILDKYAFRDKQGNLILCWDNSRFINHSFNPNCLPTPYDLELATRDIQPGEELTDHYGALNLTEPFTALPEPGTRRRQVYPHDILRHHRTWDKHLRAAFRNYEQVDQPLLPMVSAEFRNIICAVAAGQTKMDSCLLTWCGDVTANVQMAS